MNLENLKESVADALDDEDVKKTIKEEIDNAAEEKAKILLDKEKKELEEHCENYKKELAKEAQKRINEEVSKMQKVLSKYVDRVTKDFLREHEEDFRMYENVTKVETILESLKTVMAVAGIHTQEVIEGVEQRKNKYDNVLEARVKGLQDQINALHEENRTLRESINIHKQKHANLIKENKSLNRENQDVVKMGVISELKNGLTLTESKKFEKMAMNIPFSADKEYIRKLKDLKESIQDMPVLNEVTDKQNDNTEETSCIANYRKFI